MDKPLRVLNVEDSERDSALLTRHMTAAGYDLFLERVETGEAMKAALARGEWDVILCDYSMPRFSALAALTVLRAADIDVPFVIISGTVGEEIAVKALLSGANDYIPKGNLTRLIPAIERELKQADIRRANRQADVDLRVSEERYRGLFEAAPDGIMIASPKSYYLDANPGMCKMLGYLHSELIGMHATDIVARSETKDLNVALAEVMTATEYNDEWCFKRKDGSTFAGDVIARIMPDGNLLAMVRDVTERHQAEEKIRFSESQLNQAQSLTHIGSWSWDLRDNTLFWSDEHYRIYGLQPGEVEPSYDIVLGSATDGGRELLTSAVDRSLETLEPFEIYFSIRRPDGAERILASRGSVDADAHGKPSRMYGTIQDVTEVKRAENERRAISEVIQGVVTTPNLDEYLKLVHRSISDLVYAENCFVMLHDPGTDMISFEFWVDKNDPRPTPKPRGTGFASYVLRTGRSLLLTAETKKRLQKQGEAEVIGSSSASWIGVPLRTPTNTIGVLVLQHYEVEDAFSELDLEFLASVGDQIALAIERKRAQHALAESEERYRELVENAIDIIYTLDVDGNYTSVNKAGETITGYSREESLTRNIGLTVAPEYQELSSRLQAEQLAGRDVEAFELEVIGKDGRRIALEVNTRSIIENGVPVGIQGIARDISERKQALKALQESEERYRELVENALDIIYTHDLKGNYTSVNKAAETVTGYTNPEMLAMNIADSIPAGQVEKARQMVAAKLAGKKITAYELELLAKDGRRITVEVNTRIIRENGVPTGVQGIARDITERRRAEREIKLFPTMIRVGLVATAVLVAVEFIQEMLEESAGYWASVGFEIIGGSLAASVIAYFALKRQRAMHRRTLEEINERKRTQSALEESEASFKSLFDTANDAILVVNEGIFRACNPAAEKLFGCTMQDILGRSPTDFSPLEQPDGRLSSEKVNQYVDAAMRGEPQFFEWTHKRLDGTLFDAEVSLTRVDVGGMAQLQGTVRDITDRKQAEETLRESDEKFHQLADNITDAFWIRSADMSKIYYISPAYEQIWARTLQSDYAKPHEWYDFIVPADRQRVKETYATLMHEAQNIEIEYRIVRPDGEQRWVRARGFQVRDSDGSLIRLAGIVTDITEKKHSETQIERTMQRLNAAQRLGRIGDWEWDVATESISWSPEVFEITRRDPLLGPPGSYEEMTLSYDAPSREVLRTKIASAMESGEPQEYELVVVRPDGERVYVQAVAEPKKDEDGHIFAISGTIQDISARKLSETALKHSEFRYHSLFENMIEGYAYCKTIFKKDKLEDFTYVEVNGAFERLTGLKDVIGKKVSEVIPGLAKTNPELFATYGRVALTGQPEKFETYVKRLKIWLSITVYSSDRENFVAVFDNITKRRQAEAELLESEGRYRTLFETAPDGVAMFDLKMNVLMANDQSAAIFGFASSNEMIGMNAFDLISGENLVRAKANIQGMWETGRLPSIESVGVKADGSHFDAEFSATLIRNADGSPMAVLGVTRDITKRKLVEERLRSSEETLAKSQEIAHLGSWELTIPEIGNVNEGRLRWSDEVFRIFGYQPNEIEVSNEAFFNAVHPDDRPGIAAAMATALREGTDYHIEHRILRPDGSERFVYEYSEIMRDPVTGNATRMVGTIQDITSQKQLEDQFRQSQKMEAVGVLAGGIAHDFNNLLTAINGYSDLTLRKMAADDPLRQNIQQVKNAGTRAADLTSQLLAFSRKQILKPIVHNLNTVITNIEKMLRRIIRESIELRTVLAPNLGNVVADPGQVEQVIMNLAINGRDAMPQGGTLTIETQNVYLDEDYVAQHVNVSAGDYVRMTVTDTGEGMSAETQKHIFEPFFTTKEVGKGTGLGLSTVYGIVKQSGGDILVYSELGFGTTFKIYLPSVNKGVEKPKWTGDREERYLGTETILLVEDEDLVRNLVSEILSDNGYRVLEAANGKAALAICDSHPERIDLLLSDVVMPKMSGGELKKAVVRVRPEIKVLFMSGYTDDSVANRAAFEGHLNFIEKPFTPLGLAQKVREVLEYSSDLPVIT